MARKKKMTPAQRAAARWDDGSAAEAAASPAPEKAPEPEAPGSGRPSLAWPLVMIGIVVVVGALFSMGQGAGPF